MFRYDCVRRGTVSDTDNAMRKKFLYPLRPPPHTPLPKPDRPLTVHQAFQATAARSQYSGPGATRVPPPPSPTAPPRRAWDPGAETVFANSIRKILTYFRWMYVYLRLFRGGSSILTAAAGLSMQALHMFYSTDSCLLHICILSGIKFLNLRSVSGDCCRAGLVVCTSLAAARVSALHSATGVQTLDGQATHLQEHSSQSELASHLRNGRPEQPGKTCAACHCPA